MSARAKTIVSILIVAALLAAIYLFTRGGQSQTQPTSLNLSTSPLEVKLSIEDKDYGDVRDGETIALGNVSSATVVAQREGFETYTAELDLKPGEQNQIEIALRPVTEEAEALILEEDNLVKEQQVTEDYLATAEEAYDKYPILSDMPYKGRLFEIYQGLPETVGYDFGIHLHLYQGHEEEGRDAFKQWMAAHSYNVEEYDVIETVNEEKPSVNLPEPPTSKDLKALAPEDIKIPKPSSTKDLDADQLAQLFATTTTTWDTAKDTHHMAAQIRAKSLMSKKLADQIEMPHKQTTTSHWRNAAANKAKSYSWIKTYDSKKVQENTQATIEVCWAWISEEGEPAIDGPRTYEMTVSKSQHVTNYTYEDPDPFVENTNNVCQPEE